MNTAQLVGPSILMPLQGLLRWLMPASAPDQPEPPRVDQYTHEFAIKTAASEPYTTITEAQKQPHVTERRPLRIVRILEAGHSRANVGRMMISGRMADVCAELDRLAAHEAALH